MNKELRKIIVQELWEAMKWARFCSNHVWECDEHVQPKKYADRIITDIEHLFP